MIFSEIAREFYVDSRKLTDYALNSDNPKGKDKAIMFQAHLGFTCDNYEGLLQQIKEQILNANAIFQREDQYGKHYQVDLEIKGVILEQQEIVRTGWVIPPDSNIARLVTLYVRKRK